MSDIETSSASDWRNQHPSLMSAVESELQFDESTAQHDTEHYRSQDEIHSLELNENSLQSLDTGEGHSDSGHNLMLSDGDLGQPITRTQRVVSTGFLAERLVFSSSPVDREPAFPTGIGADADPTSPGSDPSDEDSNPYSAYQRFYEDQTSQELAQPDFQPQGDLGVGEKSFDIHRTNLLEFEQLEKGLDLSDTTTDDDTFSEDVDAVLNNLPDVSSYLTSALIDDEDLNSSSVRLDDSAEKTNSRLERYKKEMLTLMSTRQKQKENAPSFDDDFINKDHSLRRQNSGSRGESPRSSRIPVRSGASTPRGNEGEIRHLSGNSGSLGGIGLLSTSLDSLSRPNGAVRRSRIPSPSSRSRGESPSLNRRYNSDRSLSKIPKSSRNSSAERSRSARNSTRDLQDESLLSLRSSASSKVYNRSRRSRPSPRQSLSANEPNSEPQSYQPKLKLPLQPSSLPNSKPSVGSVSELTSQLPNSTNGMEDSFKAANGLDDSQASANESDLSDAFINQPEMTLDDLATSHRLMAPEKSKVGDSNTATTSSYTSKQPANQSHRNKENHPINVVSSSNPPNHRVRSQEHSKMSQLEKIRSEMPDGARRALSEGRRDSPSQYGEAKALKDAILALEGRKKSQSGEEDAVDTGIPPKQSDSSERGRRASGRNEPIRGDHEKFQAMKRADQSTESSTWTSLRDYNFSYPRTSGRYSTPENDSTIHQSLTISDFCVGMEEQKSSRTPNRKSGTSPRSRRAEGDSSKQVKGHFSQPTVASLSRYKAHRKDSREGSTASDTDAKSQSRRRKRLNQSELSMNRTSQSEGAAGEIDQSLNSELKNGKESEELYGQLQSEYDELLSKYAQAEVTIDAMRLGARLNLYTDHRTPGQQSSMVSQPNTARSASTIHLQPANRARFGVITSHDGTPSLTVSPRLGTAYIGTSNPTEAALELRVSQLLDQLDSFDLLSDQNSLSPAEQVQLYNKLRQAYEIIQQQYREAKEVNPSGFDAESGLAGQLYQADRRLDDYHDIIQALPQASPDLRKPSQTGNPSHAGNARMERMGSMEDDTESLPNGNLPLRTSHYDVDASPRSSPNRYTSLRPGEVRRSESLERSPRDRTDGGEWGKEHQDGSSSRASTHDGVSSISDDDTIKRGSGIRGRDRGQTSSGSQRERRGSGSRSGVKGKKPGVASASSVADSGISTPKYLHGKPGATASSLQTTARFPQESTDSGFIGSEEGKRSPFHLKERNQLETIPQNDYSESSNPSALSPDHSETRTAQWAARHKEIVENKEFSPPIRSSNKRASSSRSSQRSSRPSSSIKSVRLRELSAQLGNLKAELQTSEYQGATPESNQTSDTQPAPRKLSPVRASLALPDRYQPLQHHTASPQRPLSRGRGERGAHSDLDLSEVDKNTPRADGYAHRAKPRQDSGHRTKPRQDSGHRAASPTEREQHGTRRFIERGGRSPEKPGERSRRHPVTSSVRSEEVSRGSPPQAHKGDFRESLRDALQPPEMIDSNYGTDYTHSPSKHPSNQRDAFLPESTNNTRPYTQSTPIQKHRAEGRKHLSAHQYSVDPTMQELYTKDLDPTRSSPVFPEQSNQSRGYNDSTNHRSRSNEDLPYNSHRRSRSLERLYEEPNQRDYNQHYAEDSGRESQRPTNTRHYNNPINPETHQPRVAYQDRETNHHLSRPTSDPRYSNRFQVDIPRSYKNRNSEPSLRKQPYHHYPQTELREIPPYQQPMSNQPFTQALPPSAPQPMNTQPTQLAGYPHQPFVGQPVYQTPPVHTGQPIITQPMRQAPPQYVQQHQHHAQVQHPHQPTAPLQTVQPGMTLVNLPSQAVVQPTVQPMYSATASYHAPAVPAASVVVNTVKCNSCSGTGVLATTNHCGACGSHLTTTASQSAVRFQATSNASPVVIPVANEKKGKSYLTHSAADGSFVTEEVDVVSDTIGLRNSPVVQLVESDSATTRYYVREFDSKSPRRSGKSSRRTKSALHSAVESLDDLESSLREARRSANSLKRLSQSMKEDLHSELERSRPLNHSSLY